MKPGLSIGQSAEMEITVGPELLVSFGGQSVHNLFATSALVHHLEWVARKIIVPFLEDTEEGMGYHVEISHLMPTIPKMKVKLKATVCSIKGKKITCEVEAFNPRGKIARGTVTQAIVEKSWLDQKIKEMTLVNKLSQETKASKQKSV